MPPETYPLTKMAPHRLFRLLRGDGDQDLFQHSSTVERVEAAWFDGKSKFGKSAWLMRVVDGPKAGLLFAVSSRTSASIDEMFARARFANIAVEGLPQLGAGPIAYPPSAIGGMTVLESL